MRTAQISNIRIYPIKSLDPIELRTAELGLHSLLHDRIFALQTDDERYVNSKRTGRVNQLKASYDLENKMIHLSERTKDKVETFELNENNAQLIEYLQDFFELKLTLVKSNTGELLDVPKNSSATIVSQQTYSSLLSEFPNSDLEDLRLRFRANIELVGTEAFWEDQLFKTENKGVEFKIGDVTMIGTAPRDRCNVPPRDPHTGETDKTFVKRMMNYREQHLPSYSTLKTFDNMYCLCTDVYIPASEQGKRISVGDAVSLGEHVSIKNL